MSGGSLDYAYYKIEQAAYDCSRQADTPTLKIFAKYLLDVSKALHDVEWYLSGDIGIEQAEESIKKLFGEEWKKIELNYLQEEAKKLIEVMQKLIDK